MSRRTPRLDDRHPHPGPAAPLLPDRHSWIDIGFTVVLAGVALTALGSSFTGTPTSSWGCSAWLLAVVVTHLTRAAGWPIISAVIIWWSCSSCSAVRSA